jgi:uncharacterized membrane protein
VILLAFWLGGMTACVLQVWGECRVLGVPPVVYARPALIAALALLSLALWPGYMVMSALRAPVESEDEWIE